MILTKKILPWCAVVLTLLTSCAPKISSDKQGLSNDTNAKVSLKTSVLKEVSPVYPGPYKTVLMNGMEARQGRYSVGKSGGTLVRVIAGGDPKVFNPWTSMDSLSSQLASLMFHGLADIDYYTGEVIPDMALEIKEMPDKVTYITKLRKGLKWSDGKPITSADVAFTWNTIVAQGYGNTSMRDVSLIDGKMPVVTVVDELTNKFVTPKPFAPFKRSLGLPIAPQHIIEPIIKNKNGHRLFEQLWSASSANNFVTSGPFTLERFLPAQRVEFKKTNNFYMVNKQGEKLPYLDHIVYVIVPDVSTLLMKFKAKEIDISQLRARDISELIKDQERLNFRLYNLGPSTSTLFILFNMNRRVNLQTDKPYVSPVKSAWFNDQNFRQAINHALNRDRMIANYLKGIGEPLFVCESSISPFLNKNLRPFAQDLQYSTQLLQKSGFTKKANGLLYDKTGHTVEFDLLYGAGGTFYPAIAGMIQNDLQELGIKVNLQELAFNIIQNKMDSTKDWDAQIFGFTSDPFEPHNGANVYLSNGRLHVFDAREPDAKGQIKVNDRRPWEQEIDEIIPQAACQLDVQKRKVMYGQIQKIIYDQAPFIYLISPITIIGARNTIMNYQPTVLSQDVSGLHNLEEIWMKQDGDK